MSQISVNNLTFGYEGSYDNVFEKVSFSIDTNWKLGFIGRNGKGKTTFLRLLLGKYEFSGSIHTTTRFDYFPYEIAEAKMENPIADFMDELKPGCELWKVICELEKLSENANILFQTGQENVWKRPALSIRYHQSPLFTSFCNASRSAAASSAFNVIPFPHFSRFGEKLRMSYFGSLPFHEIRLISFV